MKSIIVAVALFVSSLSAGAWAAWETPISPGDPIIWNDAELSRDTAIIIGCPDGLPNDSYYLIIVDNDSSNDRIRFKPTMSTMPKQWRWGDEVHDEGTWGRVFLSSVSFRQMMINTLKEDHLSLLLKGAADDTISRQREFSTAGAERAADWLISACDKQPSSGSSRSGGGTGSYGDTPLHAAIRSGDDAKARQIIATTSKRDQCRTNDLGHTAGDLADIFANIHIRVLLPYDC